jgi:hypothetical protein
MLITLLVVLMRLVSYPFRTYLPLGWLADKSVKLRVKASGIRLKHSKGRP